MRSLRPCSDSSATPSFPSQPEGKIGLPRANPRGRLTLVVPAKFHKAAALLHAPARVAWATRALEKVVSWVVASSGMCQEKEPRAHILVLFRHRVLFPVNPKPCPNSDAESALKQRI